MRTLVLLLDFARSRSALLSLGEPALGALLAYGAIPPGRVMSLGLLAAVAGYLSIYALNDLLDLKADKREIDISAVRRPGDWAPVAPHLDIVSLPHPVAAGALPLWAGVTWVAILGAAGLAAAYMLRPICAWLFLVCAALEVLYCMLRSKTWLKSIPAGTTVAVGGLAGWFAVANVSWGAGAFFLLLLVWEIAGRNLSNDLADVERDRSVGIATLAATHGPKVAVRAVLTGASAMPLLALFQQGPWVPRVIVAIVALVTMSVPAAFLARRSSSQAAQRYFNRASTFPAAAAAAVLVYYLAIFLT